jgi:hypothetical protein
MQPRVGPDDKWGVQMGDGDYGKVAAVLGWLATMGGMYMWQGIWPAVAAAGLVGVLFGLTAVLDHTIRSGIR